MPKVHYLELNKKVATEPEQSILSTSIANHITHLHECGGNGRCTTCRVRVVRGLDNLTPPTEIERNLALARKWDPTVRLACQSRVTGDVEIERLVWTGPEVNRFQLETLPQGTAKEQDVAILCCDMRGFTQITAQLMTFDTAHLLNRFYTALGDPILMNNGIIYQYVGDEIVGVFGAAGGNPEEHCHNAVRAALGMQYAVARLNRYELDAFEVDLKIGIGIAYGPAYVGHLGHPKHQQFAVIGETMNIANRIQGATKETGCNLLISEALKNHLPDDLLQAGEAHTVELNGQSNTRTVWEVTGLSRMDMQLELQYSMNIMLENEEEFVTKFYTSLFEALPEVKPLFSRSMRDQGRLLMHMLSSIVYSMSRPGHLKMGLRQLGRSHVRYGVKPEYYPVLVDVLLDCMEKEFDTAVTDNTLLAWKEALKFVTDIMISAADSAQPST